MRPGRRQLTCCLIMLAGLAAAVPTAERATLRVPSAAMGRSMSALVLLPPAYRAQPDKRFPVLYLLPCAGGAPEMFVQDAVLANAVAARELLVVCPATPPLGWYVEAPC